MGETRNMRMMGSKAWAAAATMAAGAALISVGCGNDGVTPVCTNVPAYANRGDAGPDAEIAAKIQKAVDEGCLTAVQEGFGTSGGTGGAAGSGTGGTGGGS